MDLLHLKANLIFPLLKLILLLVYQAWLQLEHIRVLTQIRLLSITHHRISLQVSLSTVHHDLLYLYFIEVLFLLVTEATRLSLDKQLLVISSLRERLTAALVKLVY